MTTEFKGADQQIDGNLGVAGVVQVGLAPSTPSDISSRVINTATAGSFNGGSFTIEVTAPANSTASYHGKISSIAVTGAPGITYSGNMLSQVSGLTLQGAGVIYSGGYFGGNNFVSAGDGTTVSRLIGDFGNVIMSGSATVTNADAFYANTTLVMVGGVEPSVTELTGLRTTPTVLSGGATGANVVTTYGAKIDPLGVGLTQWTNAVGLGNSYVEGNTYYGGIGVAQSTIHNAGSLTVNRVASAIDYNVTTTDYMISITNTAAPRAVQLLACSAVGNGKRYEVKDASYAAGTNNININPAGADTIDGAVLLAIAVNGGRAILTSDGVSNWEVS